MKIKDLKRFLIENDIPDDAEIVVWADHAQDYERVHDIWVTKSKDSNYSNSIWEFDGYEDIYDDDCLDEYPVDGPVVAICIEGTE